MSTTETDHFHCPVCNVITDRCNLTEGKDMTDPVGTDMRRTYKPTCCECGAYLKLYFPVRPYVETESSLRRGMGPISAALTSYDKHGDY